MDHRLLKVMIICTIFFPSEAIPDSRWSGDTPRTGPYFIRRHGRSPPQERVSRIVSRHYRKPLHYSKKEADLVVAKDDSGQFQTVQAALDEAAKRPSPTTRFVIYVKKGLYAENIKVAMHNDNVVMIGDGIRNTIITGNRSDHGGYDLITSATASKVSYPKMLSL